MASALNELFLFRRYLVRREFPDIFLEGRFSPVSFWHHASPDGSGHEWTEWIFANEKGSMYLVNGMTDILDPLTSYSFYASPDDMGAYLLLRAMVDMEEDNLTPLKETIP